MRDHNDSCGDLAPQSALIKILQAGLVLTLLSANSAHAHPDDNGLLQHFKSGRCLDGNGSSLYMNSCQPFNPWQQWRRDGTNIRHVQSGKCLDGNGAALYFGNCSPTNNYQQWTEAGAGARLVHGASGKCLNSDGSTIGFVGCSTKGDPYQHWGHGGKITQGALNCTIKNSANNQHIGEWINGFEWTPTLFTLGRVGWAGHHNGNFYLVQNNNTGLCATRAGQPAVCNVNDLRQIYRIEDWNAKLSNWTLDHIKHNPLRDKPVFDIFENPVRPLSETTMALADPAFDLAFFGTNGQQSLGYQAPGSPRASTPIIECVAYSDRTTEFSKLGITENYILSAKYLQQESARALQESARSGLNASEQSRVKTLLASTPNQAQRTLNFYDFGAETSGDLTVRYLELGAPHLKALADEIYKTYVPDVEWMSTMVKNSMLPNLDTMEQALNSVPLQSSMARSMLESGGALAGQGALQVRLPFGISSSVSQVTLPWYVPSHGNVRLSFPAFGPKANLKSGAADPNYSYSDYSSGKADGVFHYVFTVEIDKSLYAKARESNALLPDVSLGLEIHFANSVRDNRQGSRTRLDSISINFIGDIAPNGGLINYGSAIRSKIRNNKILPEASEEVRLGTRTGTQMSQNLSFSDWLKPVEAMQYTSAMAAASDIYFPILPNPEVLTSSFFNTPQGTPVIVDMGPNSPQGRDVRRIEAVVNAFTNAGRSVNTKPLVGGLINMLGEASVGIKWLNKSFLEEASCRFNTPTLNCKGLNRVWWDFTLYPNVMEVSGMGVVSTQLNVGWKDLRIPFLPAYKGSASLPVPRFQFSGAALGWVAFDAKSADAMRAGAAQASTAAH